MTQLMTSAVGTLGAVNDVVGPISMVNANAMCLLSGTFSGTAAVEGRQSGDPNANWVLITGTRTTPGVMLFNGGCGDMQFRVRCSIYTSGTMNVYLAACPNS